MISRRNKLSYKLVTSLVGLFALYIVSALFITIANFDKANFNPSYYRYQKDRIKISIDEAFIFPLQIFAFSIICTAGISLVIWLPAGYLVGRVIFLGINKALAIKKGGLLSEGGMKGYLTEINDKPTVSRDDLALVKFIQEAQTAGYTNERLIEFLKEKNWSEQEIDRAYLRLREQSYY